MNKSSMLAVLFALGGMLGAEDTPPQIENFKGRYAPVTIDGSRAFESQTPMTLTAKEPIEVDPAKTYQLKGEFKAASPGSSFLYFGLIPYDADMREIKAQNINVLPGTLTELSEAAAQGARTIRIRNAANWKCVPARFYAAFGADITYAKELMHGRQSNVKFDRTCPLFQEIPKTAPAARYHSLAADASAIPEELRVTAVADDGEVMAVQHREYPIFGVASISLPPLHWLRRQAG